ncbi:MAG: hypothetical protein ACYC3L_00660 [Gemmatimonadaceae bacterium]
MSGDQKVSVRLAMRVEGEWWNAYAALPDTMDGAHLLGSVRLSGMQDLARKNAFIRLMSDVLGFYLTQKLGTGVVWGEPERAPEHERSGRA